MASTNWPHTPYTTPYTAPYTEMIINKLRKDKETMGYVTTEDNTTVNRVDEDVRAEMRKRLRDRLMKAKMELVDSFGDDSYPVGTVLKFVKRLGEGYKELEYVALKSDYGKWYICGPSMQISVTWEDFIGRLVSGPYP